MAAGNPFSHVIQHPLKTTEADLGPLTPNGEITLLSDQITMIILAGVLLWLLLPTAFRRRKETDEVEANSIFLGGWARAAENVNAERETGDPCAHGSLPSSRAAKRVV